VEHLSREANSKKKTQRALEKKGNLWKERVIQTRGSKGRGNLRNHSELRGLCRERNRAETSHSSQTDGENFLKVGELKQKPAGGKTGEVSRVFLSVQPSTTEGKGKRIS